MEMNNNMKLKTGKPTDVGMLLDRIELAKKRVQQWIAEDISPAFVASVARKGIVVFNEAYGSGTEDNSPHLTTDVIFPLYSITKCVVAVLTMTMVEDGLISVNRSVQSYLPEFEGENKELVGVHSLLTHTSGMTDKMWEYVDKQIKEYETNPSSFDIPADMDPWLYFGCKAPLSEKPGVCMNYGSFGMQLLATILSRVSGKSLDELLRERIFQPLNMSSSYMIVPESERSKVFKFPPDCECGDRPNREESYTNQSAGGGMYSTVNDMQIFAQMILNKGSYDGIRILSPITVDYMTRNWLPGTPANYGAEMFPEALWGLGWNICGHKLDVESGPLKSTSAFVHGGWGRCMLWIDPYYELAGILFYPKMPPEYRRFDDLFRNIIMSAISE